MSEVVSMQEQLAKFGDVSAEEFGVIRTHAEKYMNALITKYEFIRGAIEGPVTIRPVFSNTGVEAISEDGMIPDAVRKMWVLQHRVLDKKRKPTKHKFPAIFFGYINAQDMTYAQQLSYYYQKDFRIPNILPNEEVFVRRYAEYILKNSAGWEDRSVFDIKQRILRHIESGLTNHLPPAKDDTRPRTVDLMSKGWFVTILRGHAAEIFVHVEAYIDSYGKPYLRLRSETADPTEERPARSYTQMIPDHLLGHEKTVNGSLYEFVHRFVKFSCEGLLDE